jgi:hypothetical protein
VSYRPHLAERALRQMGGLPAEALEILVQTMARICDDPYDRLFSYRDWRKSIRPGK